VYDGQGTDRNRLVHRDDGWAPANADSAHCINWTSGGAGWIKFTPSYYNGDAPFGIAWGTRVIYWQKPDASGGLKRSGDGFRLCGRRARPTVQPDIRGTMFERVIDFLLNHFSVVPFRGIVRRRSSDDRPYIPTGLRRDFAADTVWMLHIALRGELRRVPSTLYAKRYHEASVHAPWRSWPREELIGLWAEQAAACAHIALEHIDDSRDREVVLAAALMRVAGVGNSRTYATPTEPLEVAAATAMFCDALGDASPLRDVQRILAYPNARLLREAIARSAEDTAPSLAWRIRRKLGSILRG
jgi:hypothetical protein